MREICHGFLINTHLHNTHLHNTHLHNTHLHNTHLHNTPFRYLEHLIKTLLPKEIEILSPSDVERRGCQLSIRVAGELVSDSVDATEYECGTNTGNKASVLQRQLEGAGIACDNRPPDVLRLPPVPLYNTFTDVHVLVTNLRKFIKVE